MKENNPRPRRSSSRGFAFPLILIVIGIIFLFVKLGIIRGGFGVWWPVLIIALGVGMLLSAMYRR